MFKRRIKKIIIVLLKNNLIKGENKLLSVIVPIYNVEEYLEQCIVSILSQSWKEFEVILVDDGSSDTSGEICDKYAIIDKRIKVCHQENKGLLCARHKGLELSSSKYVTFVDADDFLIEDSYINAVEIMKKDVDLICFGITRYYNEFYCVKQYGSYKEGFYNKEQIEKIIYPKMIWDNTRDAPGLDASLCIKIFKKEFLIRTFSLLSNKSFYYGEDAAIIYPLMKMINSLEIVKFSFYNHRKRKTNDIPPYIVEEGFFEKLYIWYCHMKEQFAEDKILMKQVDQYYIHSVNLKQGVYGNLSRKIEYLFPFDKVKKGDKIILYGAGVIGQSYYTQIMKIAYCELILWVDKAYKEYKNRNIVGIESIAGAEFDKIVVAIKSNIISKNVMRELMRMGIKKDKIVLLNEEKEEN